MSDKMGEFMKASAEGSKAKHDWLTAHDVWLNSHTAWLKNHDRKVRRLQWAVVLLAAALMLLALHATGVFDEWGRQGHDRQGSPRRGRAQHAGRARRLGPEDQVTPDPHKYLDQDSDTDDYSVVPQTEQEEDE